MSETLGWLIATAIGMLLLAFLLMHTRRLAGDRVAYILTRAPALDLTVSLFTWAPWVFAAVAGGWRAFAGALAGQILALLVWTRGHELLHRDAARGPRIVKALNHLVGPVRNHAALWATTLALPVFWVVRLAEILVYPILIWLLGFPRYRQGDWVNVSRQKFEGLVGHDLIWCLYCDWMTGVYALGGEMLRNVESFWCPIRFHDQKKCENCRLDFPDIDLAWVAPDGSMQQVHDLLLEHYKNTPRKWFGTTTAITIEGEPPPPRQAAASRDENDA